jgi:hypothetical protein
MAGWPISAPPEPAETDFLNQADPIHIGARSALVKPDTGMRISFRALSSWLG